MRHELLALGEPLYSTCSDFTWRVKNKDVELDVKTNLLFGGTPQFYLGDAIFFHDLIAQILPRTLQCGIIVMVLIDASVYAHNHHRRNVDNPGNVGDCMGREDSIYDGDYSNMRSCVPVSLPGGAPSCGSPSEVSMSLPHSRTTTREKGNDFQGWAICTEGSAEGETSARWNSGYFRKSHIRANKLDVQETDLSVSQLYRSAIIFLTQVYAWTIFLLLLFGIW